MSVLSLTTPRVLRMLNQISTWSTMYVERIRSGIKIYLSVQHRSCCGYGFSRLTATTYSRMCSRRESGEEWKSDKSKSKTDWWVMLFASTASDAFCCNRRCCYLRQQQVLLFVAFIFLGKATPSKNATLCPAPAPTKPPNNHNHDTIK